MNLRRIANFPRVDVNAILMAARRLLNEIVEAKNRQITGRVV
jgi:hypothetical protein